MINLMQTLGQLTGTSQNGSANPYSTQGQNLSPFHPLSGLFGHSVLPGFGMSGYQNMGWGSMPWFNNKNTTNNSGATTPVPAVAPPNDMSTLSTPYKQQFATGLQSILAKTTSPFTSDFYNKIASTFGNYDPTSTHTNGALGVFKLDPSVLAQYGKGSYHGMNNQIGTYVNYTNKNYTDLKTMLGREPTQAEVYAANMHGVDTANQMIAGGDPALQQYNQLFA